MRDQQLEAAVRKSMPAVLGHLKDWVAIPSVAFPGFPESPVQRMAETLVEAFTAAGLPAELRDIPGGSPAVVAEVRAPSDAPTVLLYAHYDVQPAPESQGWRTDPFVATEVDGRIYGRGAADDKGGIAVHLAALTALAGSFPVGIKLIIEGDEEAGSALEQYVPDHPDLFAADVMLIADMGNLHAGDPILTVALRGHVRVEVQLDTLAADVHSGLFGGAVPDALTALVRLLSTLTDDEGSCAVAGLKSSEWSGTQYDEDLVRSSAGMLDGVELIGKGSLAGRMWSRPAISVLGIDAPSVGEGGNVLHASARAAIGLRIPAGTDPHQAAEALIGHLKKNVPWGAHITTEISQLAPGFSQKADGPTFDTMSSALKAAYGKTPETAGSGGSIPLLDALRAVSPKAEFLLYGVEDADRANIHGPNESVDPTEIEKMALAEALLLQQLGLEWQ